MSNSKNISAWDDYSQEDIDGFGEEGDLYRQYIINPAIFSEFKDVEGSRILDAGCGTGYLARMLANCGAQVTGLEPSKSLYQYCLQREEVEQLGIKYVQQDKASFFFQSSIRS